MVGGGERVITDEKQVLEVVEEQVVKIAR